MAAHEWVSVEIINRANEGEVQESGPPKDVHRVEGRPEVGQQVTALCGLTFTVSIIYSMTVARNKCPYCFPERPELAIAA